MPDVRALAYPDEPYSAYCRVCWQAIYAGWIDEKNHHSGECMDGHLRMKDCAHAMGLEACIGQIRSYLASTAPPPPPDDKTP